MKDFLDVLFGELTKAPAAPPAAASELAEPEAPPAAQKGRKSKRS
jgi:hypothetical protein